MTILVTILGFELAKFFGVSEVDLGSFIDAADGLQVGELLLAIGAIVAGFFRKYARVNLGNPTATNG